MHKILEDSFCKLEYASDLENKNNFNNHKSFNNPVQNNYTYIPFYFPNVNSYNNMTGTFSGSLMNLNNKELVNHPQYFNNNYNYNNFNITNSNNKNKNLFEG
jgi:hypothetical protein